MYKYNFVNTFVKFSSTLKIERFVDYLLILTNTIMICVYVCSNMTALGSTQTKEDWYAQFPHLT